MIEAPQPAAEQGNPYLPKGPPEPLIFEKFEGINTATTRPGVDDKQMAWCDGWIPLGPNRNLRTLPDVGAKLWTAPEGVVFFQAANIGSTPILVVVQSDGSIYQVNTTTAVATEMAGPGTILSPSQLNVGISQYGSQYVQIVAKQTNGYFIWDGLVFYTPGGPGPTIDGSPTTMPTAIGGTAIENYSGRVWIVNGATCTFSAPGSVIDFSSGDGGGNFTSTDSFLRDRFVQLKQTNGFLYLFGDSSINYISGVQTSGSPPVTTFTNQNADPEIGTPWPNTVDVFNRNILFGNSFGAHISYGGAVQKVSEALDGVYNTVPGFGNLIPSAAKAIIYGKKIWMMLLPIIDPVTGLQVNKLMMWNGKLWFTSPQSVSLVFVQFQEIDSQLTAWGTDGSNIYPLFQTPSSAFTKTVRSRLWDTPGGYQLTKTATRLWIMAAVYNYLDATLSVSIDTENPSNESEVISVPITPAVVIWTNNSNVVVTWENNSSQVVTWYTSGTSFVIAQAQAIGITGVLTGMTFTTQAVDMALISAMIHDEVLGYRG
jgi:hypothetical protein